MWGADLISGITSKLPIIGKKEEPEVATYSCPYACPLQAQPEEEEKSLFDFEMPTLSLPSFPDLSLPSLSDIFGSKTEAEKRAEKYPNVEWTGDETLDAKLAASIDLLIEEKDCLPGWFETYGDIGRDEIIKAVKEDKIRVQNIATSNGGYKSSQTVYYSNEGVYASEKNYEGYINVSLNELQTEPPREIASTLTHEGSHSLQFDEPDKDTRESQAYYNEDTFTRKLSEKRPELFMGENGSSSQSMTYQTYMDSYKKGWSPLGLYDTGIQAFGLYKNRVIEDLKNNVSKSTYYHPELKQETNS